MTRAAITTLLLTLAGAPARADHFAVTVLSYQPAPGQFVTTPAFAEPGVALGPPRGGGAAVADNTSVVTLGAFGGSLVLGFDHLVEDHPLNPFGMDAIIFGNALHVAGDPTRRWAEPATIEISIDADGNGLADDAWYLIPGSHLAGPAVPVHAQTWDDDVSDGAYPPDDPSWLAGGHAGTWTTRAHRLPADPFERGPVLVHPEGAGASVEVVFGYADVTPTLLLGDTDADGTVDDPAMTADRFYTRPDDPLAVGTSARSGGGDAFDIAAAIDPVTGHPARLPGFHFVRITTAVLLLDGFFGESSAEIDAAADVRPSADRDDDGRTDVLDLLRFLTDFFGADVDLDGSGGTDVLDLLIYLDTWFADAGD